MWEHEWPVWAVAIGLWLFVVALMVYTHRRGGDDGYWPLD